jgi:hypothetical protein
MIFQSADRYRSSSSTAFRASAEENPASNFVMSALASVCALPCSAVMRKSVEMANRKAVRSMRVTRGDEMRNLGVSLPQVANGGFVSVISELRAPGFGRLLTD